MSSSDLMSLQDQQRLELTLGTREAIIRNLVNKGPVPSDPEDRKLLMQSLDGLDRTILSRAKIKSDDTNAKSEAEIAKSVANLLLRMDSRKRTVQPAEMLEDISLPDISTVPGETFIGVEPVKYDTIMADRLI